MKKKIKQGVNIKTQHCCIALRMPRACRAQQQKKREGKGKRVCVQRTHQQPAQKNSAYYRSMHVKCPPPVVMHASTNNKALLRKKHRTT
jgi:hypothetical protein